MMTKRQKMMARRAAASAARCKAAVAGATDGWVVVEYRGSSDHPFRLREGRIMEGILTVGGCTPSPSMIGRVLSKPYRYGVVKFARRLHADGVEWDAICTQDTCTLASGETLHRVNDGSCYWVSERAGGSARKVNLLQYIVETTPAAAAAGS